MGVLSAKPVEEAVGPAIFWPRFLTKSPASKSLTKALPRDHQPRQFQVPPHPEGGQQDPTSHYSLIAAEKNGLKGASKLPYSMKVLLENLLRHEDGNSVTAEDIKAVVAWQKTRTSDREIAFRPARVLMQDLTGVPAVVDLAAMRDAMKTLGGNPEKINPLR